MKKESNFNKKEAMSKITPIIENIAAKNGLIPIEISFVKESGRWFLRIFIYSPDHPITHQDCENITRGLNDYLDELLPVKYYLEVSSPGADRKLKSEREYNLFKGKKVKIKLKQPVNDSNEHNILATLGDYRKGVSLNVTLLDSQEELTIDQENITSVKLCIE